MGALFNKKMSARMNKKKKRKYFEYFKNETKLNAP